ncbi:hypothetical protein BaRGS_00023472 [Batillaria attramentaria]|uniref:Uncharacterized protein n=1 Tax=Batillaria attramentaria TaxID=370345 RepID=A0ABD0KDP1_9CAEN
MRPGLIVWDLAGTSVRDCESSSPKPARSVRVFSFSYRYVPAPWLTVTASTCVLLSLQSLVKVSIQAYKYMVLHSGMHSLTIWLLCLLVHGLAVVVEGSTCESKANGCSTFDLDLPYKDRFTPSCNKHDICYYCGADRGLSRECCDDEFRDNMKKSCDTLDNFLTKTACKASAESYYAAARAGGGMSGFRRDCEDRLPPSWCNETWVSACLPSVAKPVGFCTSGSSPHAVLHGFVSVSVGFCLICLFL